jgi:hypothetical protein
VGAQSRSRRNVWPKSLACSIQTHKREPLGVETPRGCLTFSLAVQLPGDSRRSYDWSRRSRRDGRRCSLRGGRARRGRRRGRGYRRSNAGSFAIAVQLETVLAASTKELGSGVTVRLHVPVGVRAVARLSRGHRNPARGSGQCGRRHEAHECLLHSITPLSGSFASRQPSRCTCLATPAKKGFAGRYRLSLAAPPKPTEVPSHYAWLVAACTGGTSWRPARRPVHGRRAQRRRLRRPGHLGRQSQARPRMGSRNIVRRRPSPVRRLVLANDGARRLWRRQQQPDSLTATASHRPGVATSRSGQQPSE